MNLFYMMTCNIQGEIGETETKSKQKWTNVVDYTSTSKGKYYQKIKKLSLVIRMESVTGSLLVTIIFRQNTFANIKKYF